MIFLLSTGTALLTTVLLVSTPLFIDSSGIVLLFSTSAPQIPCPVIFVFLQIVPKISLTKYSFYHQFLYFVHCSHIQEYLLSHFLVQNYYLYFVKNFYL
jgi:hypothetical protein